MAEDAEARKMAALANQKIDSHEDRCSERWREARDGMKGLQGGLEILHSRINTLYRTMLLVALGLAGFALVQWLLAKGVAG